MGFKDSAKNKRVITGTTGVLCGETTTRDASNQALMHFPVDSDARDLPDAML